MIFKIFVLALFEMLEVYGLIVGVYEMPPYIGRNDGVFNQVCKRLEIDTGEDFEFLEFDEGSEAELCVLKGKCDFTLAGIGSNLTLSYPVLSVFGI